MKILVTGGAGYVGQLLVPALDDLGHYVTVADWLMFGDWPKGSVQNILVDIRDQDNKKFNRALRECDCIIHLASIANDPSADLDPGLTWEVNLGGTVNIINKCSGQRIIYASTSSVYGIKEEPPNEKTPLNPLTCYSKSKVWAEQVVNPSIPEIVVVRPATLCGYSPRMRFDLMVNSFVAQAMTHEKIKVWGPDQYRANLHVKDMVSFYCLLVTHSAFYEEEDVIFNVVAQNMKIREIAELVADCIPGTKIEFSEDSNDKRSYQVDGSKAEKFFTWKPKFTIRGAIDGVAKAIRDGLTDPSDPRNYNCTWMQTADKYWFDNVR